ncbi:hypothetical protein FNV43_RR11247 [Rhamnella rubrinervis]|uniref:Conserved oligomeric Golgi complex subunit 8 n=1 Tax=Rhamnella rubrinervis TaxID=2594499 RepID=A0A8K0H603_9ROSA|nr:hypothetical protein FNV43_RR11247 [Rhamnella rubrinervis]
MGQREVLVSMRRNYPLRVFCFIGLLITFATLTYEDHVGEPESGLLCISDCTTCPVICSPPPPVLESHPPPPTSQPVHRSPPRLTTIPSLPPPKQTPSPSPPPRSPPKEMPPSPPSQPSSWGTPPPPFKYFFNMPPSGPVLVPPSTTSGPHDYSYPYYYFYASKAPPVSAHHIKAFGARNNGVRECAGGDVDGRQPPPSCLRLPATLRLRAPLIHSRSPSQGPLALAHCWSRRRLICVIIRLLNSTLTEFLYFRNRSFFGSMRENSRQMQEVAVGNYRAFIAAADALLAIREEVSSIDKHLESLCSTLSSFGIYFDLNASYYKSEFGLILVTDFRKEEDEPKLLANHSTLLDLLEIPQLMDTCVRNGNYDEALDLEAFVCKLSTMHPKLPVIQALAAEVGQITQSLLSQLLQKLRSNIQAWLTGILEDLDQRNAYEYLKGMINCHRMHLFDVVNQYRAIFAGDTSGSEENYDGGLLFSWAMHQITSHLKTLKVMLPKITEGGSLSNILDQCMVILFLFAYVLCNGAWLGWTGFSGLLPSLFEEAVLNLFSKNMSTAVENFQLVLDSHRWVPLPAVGFPANSVGEDTQEEVTPPSYLMEHPPLAVFVNGVSAAMNDLRPCAPVSLKHVLAQELIKGLQAVSDSLLRYNTTRMLRENETGLFLSLCRAFIEVAYPHCATCFSRCYPGGASLIMDAKNLCDGIGRLLTVSSTKEVPKPDVNADAIEEKSPPPPPLQTDETPSAPVSDGAEEGQTAPRLQIYSTSTNGVSQFWREKYEREARKYWDVFYKRHQDKFFKDRHYLDKEWGRYFIGTGRKVILEVGCGAGNTIFPLVATYPDVFVYACDFSPRAVNLVKTHKDFTEAHVSAFVCDLTVDDLTDHIPPSSVDIVTMIFVLSAVAPEKMPLVLQNVRKILKPNGYVLFRDYATGDLAQERLICKDQKISENFYVRGDGTRAFYFSNEFLTSVFKENGFDVEEIGLCCKQVENRSRELVMNRRWIQAVFHLSDGTNFAVNSEAAIQAKENIVNKAENDVEVDISDGVAAEMFGDMPSSDNEITEINHGDYNFKIKMLSKVYQHTCKSTGKRVLELGCGCVGICSMIAANFADYVMATDGDTKAIELLNQNVASNLRPPILDKMMTRRLEWGNRDNIEAIKEVNNGGFDVIIGTDVTYVAEAISPLFATARELISTGGGTAKDQGPALILCHIVRQVDEASMLSTALQFGFRLVDRWPSGISTSPLLGIINSWFPDNNSICIPNTALNILYFCTE